MIKVRIVIALALLILAFGVTIVMVGVAGAGVAVGGGQSLGSWLLGMVAFVGLVAMAAGPRPRVRRG